jgi:hypothetical protein
MLLAVFINPLESGDAISQFAAVRWKIRKIFLTNRKFYLKPAGQRVRP